MHDEIERVDGEIRLWWRDGLRWVWRVAPGKRFTSSRGFLQRYVAGAWRSIPMDARAHPPPMWPM